MVYTKNRNCSRRYDRQNPLELWDKNEPPNPSQKIRPSCNKQEEINLSIPAVYRVNIKWKTQQISGSCWRVLKKLCNMNVTVILIIIKALRKIPNRVGDWWSKERLRMPKMQNCWDQQEYLEEYVIAEETCCYWNWKPSLGSGMKNLQWEKYQQKQQHQQKLLNITELSLRNRSRDWEWEHKNLEELYNADWLRYLCWSDQKFLRTHKSYFLLFQIIVKWRGRRLKTVYAELKLELSWMLRREISYHHF